MWSDVDAVAEAKSLAKIARLCIEAFRALCSTKTAPEIVLEPFAFA
jgi:hypothetical protein